jgi:four helix bundle protein
MAKGVDTFQFEELKVYQKALDFLDYVYDQTVRFPQSQAYILTSQYQRAALSVVLNIAEGAGGTSKEFIRALRIARNSVKECVACVTVALRRNYINQKDESATREKLVELSKMLSGLIESIRSKSKNNLSPIS